MADDAQEALTELTTWLQEHHVPEAPVEALADLRNARHELIDALGLGPGDGTTTEYVQRLIGQRNQAWAELKVAKESIDDLLMQIERGGS